MGSTQKADVPRQNMSERLDDLSEATYKKLSSAMCVAWVWGNC
jgi:hypothetical protein